MRPDEALNLIFFDQDNYEETSIADYFKLQLATLWEEGESFSGKRPFGNSGWEMCLDFVLVKNGCIKGTIDEEDPDYPEVYDVDSKERDAFIQQMIEAL
jgi:hypothetical protein